MTLKDYITKGYELFGPDAMKILTRYLYGEIDFATCALDMAAPVANYRLCKAVTEKRPNKIKITSKFAEYLKTTQIPFVEDTAKYQEGYVGKFDAIPFEIDDTIENEYYKLIYEETENA